MNDAISYFSKIYKSPIQVIESARCPAGLIEPPESLLEPDPELSKVLVSSKSGNWTCQIFEVHIQI